MQNKYAEVTPRNFNPMWAPGLSEEARKAVSDAFDAMSSWRIEMANNSEKNSEKVIEKMAAAARTLGWPEQIVDATRQMQSITKMQIQTMDHMMDAWEEQIKSPKPMTDFPSAMLSKLKSLPGFSPTESSLPMNPVQFWMQFAEQWQKPGQTRWAFSVKAGKAHVQEQRGQNIDRFSTSAEGPAPSSSDVRARSAIKIAAHNIEN